MRQDRSGHDKRRTGQDRTGESELVSWRFEPNQPQSITSGLRTGERRTQGQNRTQRKGHKDKTIQGREDRTRHDKDRTLYDRTVQDTRTGQYKAERTRHDTARTGHFKTGQIRTRQVQDTTRQKRTGLERK